jgi:iron complex outermembrane recepter protein
MGASNTGVRCAGSVSWLALAVAGALAAPAAHAQDDYGRDAVATAPPDGPAPQASASQATEVHEVVVRAPKTQAASVAPVASSLQATEPEAVITRRFIEESAPRVGDFTTDAILAPSLSSSGNPNGPGSTDGSKLTLRGFTDGNYNVTYDGIAWGDTNGPSHHANSFFPNSTIGGIVVDRGPGDATALGQANFGGSVNLFSLPFETRPHLIQTVTGGSFGTWQAVTTLASGPQEKLHDANVVLNFMEYGTDGYLTNSASRGYNQFGKITLPVTSHLKLTALYTHNWDHYYQSDSSATADVAQTERFGKRFALSTDPTQSTYYKYNQTTKTSEFEYLRGDLDLGHGLTLWDTVYSYAYNNQTFSANNTLGDVSNGTPSIVPGLTAAQAGANVVTPTPPPGTAYPAPGKAYSSKLQAPGIPGYNKLNKYRVTGNIFELNQQTDFGLLTAGVLYEAANTQRHRYDYNAFDNLMTPDYREKAAQFPGPSGCYGLPAQSNGACEEPLDIAYQEFSGWRQYQAFAQFAWTPIRNLTITPGFKFVDFDLFVHAPALAVSGSIQPAYVDHTYTQPLGFLTANYRVGPDWSVYGQWAQGFLVPNISAFYVNNPNLNPIKPQLSTNYQIGTVFAARDVTFDADIYYINFTNKIQTINELVNGVPNGETFETNTGNAIYKGIEGQVTYLLPQGLSVFGNGSLNDARGYGDTINTGNNGRQLAQVPFWTAALGVRFGRSHILFNDDALVSTLDTKWTGQQYANAASGAAVPTALLRAWAEANWSTTYRKGNYAVEAQVLNLFDTSDITAFKGKALIPGTNLPATTSAEGGAQNVFTYQAGRSVQVTLRAEF